MKQKVVSISVLAAAVLAINGCGSSSSSSTTPPTATPTTGTALYVDSAVEGVSVTCGSTTSVTDAEGRFTYEDGKDCQFSVGSVVLRTESGLYQDKVIIEDNIQTAQYLQSMDYDGNPDNGITIHNQTAEVMAQHNRTHVPTNDQELAECVADMENADIGYQGHFVHEQDAQEHVEKTKVKHEQDNQNNPHNPDNNDQQQNTPNDQEHPSNNDQQQSTPNDQNHPDNNDQQQNTPNDQNYPDNDDKKQDAPNHN